MKRPRPAALCALLAVLLGLVLDVGGAATQTPVAAPTIDSVAAADGSLTLTWTAPAGVTGITAYDLRHIETSADETVDANWTVVQDVWTTGAGDLTYPIEGLDNGVGYDVQMRTVTTLDGAWSATATGTPRIPGPTIDAVLAGEGALTVTWSAPPVAATTEITAYDLRYIRTSANENVEANWTVEEEVWTRGALRYVLPGLSNGTSYDIQVRAVAGASGAWSATTAGTPAAHGSTLATATTLPLGTHIGGVIQPGSDADVFKFVLAEATGIIIFTRGDLDTVGELLDVDGMQIDSNDDGYASHGIRNFLIWRSMQPGTYHVKVTSFDGATGPYVLQTTLIKDTTSRSDAQTIELDELRNGIIDPEDDADYFTFTLSGQTDLLIRSTGFVDAVAELQDSDGTLVAYNDDGFFSGLQFRIRASLAAGTYYVVVSSFDGDGLYSILVETVTEPGSTLATALPLRLGATGGGRIDPSNDLDYFRIDVDETTYLFLRALSDDVDIDGAVLDADGNMVEAAVHEETFVSGGPIGFTVSHRLDPGTHYLRVSRSGGAGTGTYGLRALEDRALEDVVTDCTALTTSFPDPLYGCQWGLDNTGQLQGTSGQDIRVEEAWAAGHLGAGVTVAVVDDGLHHPHEDLRPNVDTARNHDYTGLGEVAGFFSDHGTPVAGIIAARDNGLGVRGVAPRATIYGFNLLRRFEETNRLHAATHEMATTAVYNNSWGWPEGPGLDSASDLWDLAVESGIAEGYGGKGVFYVWAGGNGALDGDNANFEEFLTHHGVTAVCAVNDLGRRSVYSEEGANLWVCGPSSDGARRRPGVATTDVYNRYRATFGGTSAAAPVVSGVAALVRGANPSLTWRDVKLILAASARKNDPSNRGWTTGARKYGSTSQRYAFNHEYGFGVVDAKAAVDLATSWTNLPAMTEETQASADTDLAIPDLPLSGTPVTVSSSITIGSEVQFVEFVEINTTFDHTSFRDLEITLTSPSGAVSTLAVPLALELVLIEGLFPLHGGFRFGSARHLGEDPAGTWTLRLTDRTPEDEGTLESWSLTVYGHRSSPGPPSIDDVAAAGGSLRVDWMAPENFGASPITAYDVRYIRSDATDKSDGEWTVVHDAWTAGPLTAEIGGLTADIEYDVQVRAVNATGDGLWSETKAEKPGDTTTTPSFDEGATTTRTIAENSAGGVDVGDPVAATDPNSDTLTYSLGGPDASLFSLGSSDGQLSVASGAALDYETPGSYFVTVTAGDPSGNSDTITVTITLTNVEEAGTVALSHAKFRVGAVLRARVDDPDGNVRSVTWRWAKSADQSDWTTISGVTGASYTPVSADVGMYLRAAASYSDGEGSGKSAEVVSGAPVAGEEAALQLAVNPLVSGLTHPWGIAFAPDGTMLFTERGGVLSARLSDGTVQTVSADLSDLYASAETGLMGIVVDPDFATNRRFYTCQGHSGRRVEVIAWTIDAAYTTATRVADPLVGGIPAGSRHGGCRLRFGPQGYLWVATGDAKVGTVPQDPLSRGGKVLRVDASTGAGAPDNPAAPSPVYTSGHRNVQGLALRPGTSQMWSVEHGPTVDDEINLLTAGGNYGWDPVPGYNERVPMTDLAKFPNAVEARWSSGDRTIATSGGIFLEGSWWGDWEGRLAVASLKDESLRLFEFTANGDLVSEIVVAELDGTYDRLRTPMIGPNGALYVATSNGGRRDQILIVAPNQPPEFPATTDTQSVPENADLSTIAATVTASDPNEDALTYALSGDDAASFTIPAADVGALRVAGPLDHETAGVLRVIITASDPHGASDSIDLTILVTDVNEAPAFPSSDSRMRRVAEDSSFGQSVDDPVAAEDDDDDPLTYTLGGTNAASFGIVESSGQLSVRDPLDHEAKSRYSVTVSVSDMLDDNGDPDTVIDDTIRVTILVTDVNEPPEITGRDNVDFAEHGTGTVATYGVTDPERGTVIWEALEGTDRDAFTFSGGVLRFSAPPDFEDPTDAGGDNEYVVTLRASDGEHMPTFTVTVEVENEEETGALALSSEQPQVGALLTTTLTDPDGSIRSESWSWHRSTNRSSWSEISGETSSSYAPVAADLNHYLRVTVEYSDGEGSGKRLRETSDQRTQEPPPMNYPPEFADTSTTRSVPEKSGEGVAVGDAVTATDDNNDRLTYTLDDNDGALFTIDGNGRIRVGEGAVLDHEDPSADSYSVTVTATDPSNASDSISVDITVTDVNEAPDAEDDSDSTDEDMAVTIEVLRNDDDPDEGDPNDTLTVSLRSRPTNGVAEVDAAANDITYTPNANYHGADSFTYRVYDGTLYSGDATVAVTVDSVNDPPAFPAATAQRSVSQNAQPGANVGRPVAATDVEGDALTYSLSGSSAFAIDEDTGQIRVAENTVLDPATQDTYTVMVTAEDPSFASASVDVTITVRQPPTRGGGGGGGGGFGGPILSVTAVVAGDAAPAGLSFGFAYTCANARGEPVRSRTFSVAAGRTDGSIVAAGLTCSLTVTDDGGASAVDGLFAGVVMPPAGYSTTVTFTFGPTPTAVPLEAETVVEEAGVALTIPEGSREAPYAVLLETDSDSCEAALDLDGESLACHTVTLFDAEGAEETGVTLLVPATITITLDTVRIEELGGVEGVRAARERGELRMRQRDDADSPWRELPFTVVETDEGGVEIVVSVQQFSDFSLITAPPRLQKIGLHADWNVVVWDGADGASIPDALGDIAGQIDVIYQWLAETQTWRSHRPAGPSILSAFDTFTRGASYWLRASEAVEWTVVGGPLEPSAAESTRLHSGWTEVVWRGADGAAIAEALGPDLLPQVEVIYRWLAETQTWGSFRPGAPAFLNAFDTFASGASYWIAVAEAVDWAAP